jgi:hypothetical protein
MRLLHTLSSHWANAAATATITISTTMRRTPLKSTFPLPSIISMALPQRMGIYSWAATLTAATIRLHTTKKL